MRKYGSFEAHPCIYDEDYAEGWVMFGSKKEGSAAWRKLGWAEVFNKVGIITEEKFKQYGELPPLPPAAFAETLDEQKRLWDTLSPAGREIVVEPVRAHLPMFTLAQVIEICKTGNGSWIFLSNHGEHI
jgi:hypothetical protein